MSEKIPKREGLEVVIGGYTGRSDIIKGYKPPIAQRPQVLTPPSGESNVMPPTQNPPIASGNKKS